MDFFDVVGQDKLIHYLKMSIENKRIGHAYIFEGPEGMGKFLTAMAFVKGIQCKNNHGDPCNTCSSCLKVDRHNHPDIIIIEPDGKHIKNKQIEEFQKDLLRKPYESHKKIYMIKDAQSMTVSAQNRLLKTLEEPPEYGVILFLSTNANLFLPTIRSRCQILKFQRVGEKKIQDFIENKYGVNGEEAKILAAFSDGIIGKAIELKESETFKKKREETLEVIESLLQKDPLKAFEAVEFFQNHKEKVDEILDMMSLWFRDILLLGATHSERFLINLDKKNTLHKHLNYIGYEKTSNIIEIIEKTKKDIKANVNFQLSIEIMLLTMQEV